MSKVILELTPETHHNFLKLKKAIENMAGESVSDDNVVDFMIRSLMSSVELPEEEHKGCGCCCSDHDYYEHPHHHHDHAHHAHHHCHCEDEYEEECECGGDCDCGDDCACERARHCGCHHH